MKKVNKKIIQLLEKIVEQNQQIIDNISYKGLGNPKAYNHYIRAENSETGGGDGGTRIAEVINHRSYDGTIKHSFPSGKTCTLPPRYDDCGYPV